MKQSRETPESSAGEFHPVPPRSLLYPLQPIAMGTPFVEAITFYLNRLAGEHMLSAADLIELDVFPISVSATEDRRTRRRSFLAGFHLLDGSESHTEIWVRGLELATTLDGLAALTLLPYTKVCDGPWVRKSRAWCPYCLEIWKQSLSDVYEPLLWSIKVSHCCPVHQTPLEDHCPHCGRHWAQLAARSKPGHCAWCQRWLGKSLSAVNAPVADPYEIWCSNEAASLVGAMPTAPDILPEDTVARGLQSLFGARAALNLSSIADFSGCTRRSIGMWLEGVTRPRLESLFRLCYAFNITPVQLMGLRQQAGEPRQEVTKPCIVAGSFSIRRRDRASGKQRGSGGQPRALAHASLDELRVALERAVDAGQYVSPRKLAKELGYSSPDRALRKFADLCTALKTFKEQATKARQNEIRTKLKNALSRRPVPTLDEIAGDLGMSSSSNLRSQEPALCGKVLDARETGKAADLKRIQILLESAGKVGKVLPLRQLCSQAGIPFSVVVTHLPEEKSRYEDRYQAWRLKQRDIQEEKFRRNVERAVSAIRRSGEFPSVGRVVEFNPGVRAAGWNKIAQAIQRALESQVSKYLGTSRKDSPDECDGLGNTET
jgi:transcriptional regulator with XRE-family HTH domain